MTIARSLGVRWTIGDVSMRGFEALRLSIWGAWKLFGSNARYLVCVNTVPADIAKARVGTVPEAVDFRDVTREVPDFLHRYFDDRMAEGVGWRLAPLQVFPDRHELALDNDCLLWEQPDAIRDWLEDDGTCMLAEDVRTGFGQFASFCAQSPRNTGIRGLPPGFDLEGALTRALACLPVRLVSEVDEQGLQVAALSGQARHIVRLSEVTICSPFPPHIAELGSCGAHFVGLNAKRFSWTLHDRPVHEYIREHWDRHRAELYARVGVPM